MAGYPAGAQDTRFVVRWSLVPVYCDEGHSLRITVVLELRPARVEGFVRPLHGFDHTISALTVFRSLSTV